MWASLVGFEAGLRSKASPAGFACYFCTKVLIVHLAFGLRTFGSCPLLVVRRWLPQQGQGQGRLGRAEQGKSEAFGSRRGLRVRRGWNRTEAKVGLFGEQIAGKVHSNCEDVVARSGRGCQVAPVMFTVWFFTSSSRSSMGNDIVVAFRRAGGR